MACQAHRLHMLGTKSKYKMNGECTQYVNYNCTTFSNNVCTTYLSPGDRLGLVFTVQAAFISCIAVAYIFLVLLRNAKNYLQNNPDLSWWRVINSPMEVYMISLLIADFLHGVGTIMNMRHVHRGIVACGPFCSVQGAILELSITAVAMSILAITVQTFLIIYIRKIPDSVKVSLIIVGIIWLYVWLFVGIALGLHPTGDDSLYTPTPFWCWVSQKYPAERLMGEYFWLWLTGFVSIVVYALLYNRLRGRRLYKLSHTRDDRGNDNGQQTQVTQPQAKGAAEIALAMLTYPVAYIFQIIGLSVVRWIGYADGTDHIPSWATFLSYTVFAFSGVINVLVLIYTRPRILLLGTNSPRAINDSPLGLPNECEMNEYMMDIDNRSGHLELRSVSHNGVESNSEG